MSSAKYPKGLEAALTAFFADTPTVQAVGAGYTYDVSHQVVDDLTDLLGDAIALDSPDYTDGILSATMPFTITGLSPGDVITGFVVYNDTGNTATSKLARFVDEISTGAPVAYTSDGSDLDVRFPAVVIVRY